MKLFNLMIFFIMLFFASNLNPAFSDCGNDASPKALYFKEKIAFTKVDADSSIVAYHKKLSDEDLKKFGKAVTEFREENFRSSLNILEVLKEKYPEDLVILQLYSDVLFMAPGKRELSFKSYKSLITLIDKYGYEELAETTKKPVDREKQAVINTTFMGVYWKTGSFHFENQNYQEAYIDFCKVMLIINHNNLAKDEPQLAAACYEYLTKASYYLKNKPNNEYFYCKTKKYNPENKDIDRFELK